MSKYQCICSDEKDGYCFLNKHTVKVNMTIIWNNLNTFFLTECLNFYNNKQS